MRKKPIPHDDQCADDGCQDKGTYQVEGGCHNCRAAPIIGTFTKGHEVRSGLLGGKCPVCDCRSLWWGDSA